MRPFPLVSLETRSSGSIDSINKVRVRDMEFIGIDPYHGAIDLVKLLDFGPVSGWLNHIIINLVPF